MIKKLILIGVLAIALVLPAIGSRIDFVPIGSVLADGQKGERVEKEIDDLKNYLSALEGGFIQVMGELQETIQQAKPVFEEAEKVMGKKTLTCQDKVKINLAAFFEQRINVLKLTIMLIDKEHTITNMKIAMLKEQRVL